MPSGAGPGRSKAATRAEVDELDGRDGEPNPSSETGEGDAGPGIDLPAGRGMSKGDMTAWLSFGP